MITGFLGLVKLFFGGWRGVPEGRYPKVKGLCAQASFARWRIKRRSPRGVSAGLVATLAAVIYRSSCRERRSVTLADEIGRLFVHRAVRFRF